MTGERSLGDFDGPRLISARRFPDSRGYFQVSWNDDLLTQNGIETEFVQDNFARSRKGVVRGLHYQNPCAQGKLVSVLEGEIIDVIVDLRADSPTEGDWAAVQLSADIPEVLWVPKGFAHGYQALSDDTLVMYKVDAPYRPDQEISVSPTDPALAITWPVTEIILNDKDRAGLSLADAPRWTEEVGS